MTAHSAFKFIYLRPNENNNRFSTWHYAFNALSNCWMGDRQRWQPV